MKKRYLCGSDELVFCIWHHLRWNSIDTTLSNEEFVDVALRHNCYILKHIKNPPRRALEKALFGQLNGINQVEICDLLDDLKWQPVEIPKDIQDKCDFYLL